MRVSTRRKQQLIYNALNAHTSKSVYTSDASYLAQGAFPSIGDWLTPFSDKESSAHHGNGNGINSTVAKIRVSLDNSRI
jgi:hypothetical protein